MNALEAREAANYEVHAMLRDGVIASPDATNPVHARLAGIARELAAEHGLSPRIYILPTPATAPEVQDVVERRHMLRFQSIPPNQTLILPEAADEYLTDDEIRGLILHEFGHLKDPATHRELMATYGDYRKAFSAAQREKDPQQKDERAQARDEAFARLQDVVDRSEREADSYSIQHGHGSDMISATQKHYVMEYGREEEGLMPPDEVLKHCEERSQKHNQRSEHDSSRPHLSETFLQRVQRMEKEAEAQESRGR